jgi:hypothetical protein
MIEAVTIEDRSSAAERRLDALEAHSSRPALLLHQPKF